MNNLSLIIVVTYFSFVLSGCLKTEHSIFPKDVEIREGDIVFRLGGSFSSDVVNYIDTAGNFSHVGIVVSRNDRLMIVHAVPDELDFDEDVDRIKLDSIGAFFLSSRASYGAVCRVKDDSISKRASLFAYDFIPVKFFLIMNLRPKGHFLG